MSQAIYNIISELLVRENAYDFLLTSRFTRDAVENVFSQTRILCASSI